MKVINREVRAKSFSGFLVGLCAVVGGTLTVAAAVDRAVYEGVNRVKKMHSNQRICIRNLCVIFSSSYGITSGVLGIASVARGVRGRLSQDFTIFTSEDIKVQLADGETGLRGEASGIVYHMQAVGDCECIHGIKSQYHKSSYRIGPESHLEDRSNVQCSLKSILWAVTWVINRIRRCSDSGLAMSQ